MQPVKIYARFSDGTVRELVKDCDCTNHIGPHWLAMDRRDRQANSEMLNAGNVQGFLIEDIARLNRKEFEMVSRGIDEIIPEWVPD